MPPVSPSLRNQILKTAASFAAVLVLAAMVYLVVDTVVDRSSFFSNVPPPHREEGTGVVVENVSAPHTTYPITGIVGINDVINAIANPQAGLRSLGSMDSQGLQSRSTISSAVLPHHTIVGPQLLDLWTNLAARTNPSVIVIVGPNHSNLGTSQVQTTYGDWPTPFGTVSTSDAIVGQLVDIGGATNEPDSFVNEHSIGTHVSYVAKLFPGVPIVPIIAKSTADAAEARAFELTFERSIPSDALIVYSIDFSHYLPDDLTANMDAETIALADRRDYDAIQGLGSDHLDSPFALMTYLMANDRAGNASTLVWHSSSHVVQGTPDAPGTSYLVYESRRPPLTPPAYQEGKRDGAVTLSLVGDMMLGRFVATSLSRTTIESAFSSAKTVLDGSDLVFGNLESVLTSSDNDTGKSIFFKGDPARVDVLRYLGFTDLSVANNHVDDYGKVGWEESVQILKDAGFRPVGDYNDRPMPTVASLGDKRVVFLAYHDLYYPIDETQLASDIVAATKLGDIVAVSFHWGVEYAHNPTDRQTKLARLSIDAGADIVIGTHPHVLQGIEKYKDGLIFYSLGNFIFDQIGTDENESLVAKIAWNDPSTGSGPTATRTLELVPMRIVGTFPRVATDAEAAATIARIASWSPEPGFIHAGEIAW